MPDRYTRITHTEDEKQKGKARYVISLEDQQLDDNQETDKPKDAGDFGRRETKSNNQRFKRR